MLLLFDGLRPPWYSNCRQNRSRGVTMARLYIGNLPHVTAEHELQAWIEQRPATTGTDAPAACDSNCRGSIGRLESVALRQRFRVWRSSPTRSEERRVGKEW